MMMMMMMMMMRCLQLVVIVLLHSLILTHGHNWINNPRSRVPGLSKELPCPGKLSEDSISFAVYEGQAFPLEWATGHPNSFTYFAIVSAEDEEKLQLHTEALFDDYIKTCPVGSRSTDPNGFLSEKAYQKTHMHWTAPLPTAGSGDGVVYEKKLKQGDDLFFARPANWRCSRRGSCNNVEFGHYQYKSSVLFSRSDDWTNTTHSYHHHHHNHHHHHYYY